MSVNYILWGLAWLFAAGLAWALCAAAKRRDRAWKQWTKSQGGA